MNKCRICETNPIEEHKEFCDACIWTEARYQLLRADEKAHNTQNTMNTTESEILKFATERWGKKTLENLAIKLAEETGEIAGAISKIPELRASFHDLDAELGDALIVLSQFAALRGTTLEALRAARFEQIKGRINHGAVDITP